MEKENIRFYIKVRTALNIEPKSIYDELYSVFGDSAPAYSTVAKWSKSFRDGRERIEDEPRIGRPVTETTSENIENIRSIVNSDPHVTIDEIQLETGLSRGTIERIMSDHLKLRKLTARWVPNFLTDWQKSERVRICKENLVKFRDGTWRLCDVVTGDESWFYHKQIGRKISNAAWVAEGEAPPTVVRRSRYAAKTLFCIFFKTTGPVLVHRIDRGDNVNNDYYIHRCLTPLIQNVLAERPKSGTHAVKLHHDNARPHVHKNVYNFLKSNGITVIQQPPNSPDLAPSDFWLFDRIKLHLEDQDSSESMECAVTKIVFFIDKAEYRKTFEKWLERMELCIEHEGNYFEHFIK
jgi:[histone H3]-lysine36 N-dimethyltransferase SETMAR